jgi:hypothetical protein
MVRLLWPVSAPTSTGPSLPKQQGQGKKGSGCEGGCSLVVGSVRTICLVPLGRLATLALRCTRASTSSSVLWARNPRTGCRSILTSHLVHRLPRKQRTRALTRSNLAVYLIQTRLPESVAKRECSAGSAEGPRSKRQRGARPANDTRFRKVTTGKTTAWNCTSRQQILRVKVPEAALSEPASIS